MNPTDKIKKQKAFENPYDRNAYDLQHSKIKKQAIKYASDNCPALKESKEFEARLRFAFIAGYNYASQWNSPDEKPEQIHDRNQKISKEVLFYIKDKEINECFVGYYDYDDNCWCPNHSWRIFMKINGWQYLPEVK